MKCPTTTRMKTWFALLLFVTLAQSPAADPIATLTELRAALREELKSALDKGNVENNQRLFQLESLLVESLPDKELPDERMAQTIQALLQVRAISRDKKVGELAESLVSALRAESKDAAKRLQENFDKTVAKCIREGLKATKPGELEAHLKEIAGLKRQARTLQNRSSESQIAFSIEGLPAAEEFLNQFQDLLVAAEKGTAVNGPAQRMKGLNSSRQLIGFIPRTELDELLESAFAGLKARHVIALGDQEFDQKIQEIIDSVTKPEDLGGALKQLQSTVATQQKATGSYFSGAVFTSIKTINRIHEDVLAGRATTVELSLLTQNEEGDRTGKIKNMLFRFLMPRVLGSEPENGMKEGETLSVFLIRTVAVAIEKRNWSQLSKILDFCGRIPSNLSPLSVTDNSAFKQFLAALNLERTHQYPASVAAYHAALKTGSQNIPLDFIGERLGSIEKEHAKEFQMGIELANNPVVERYVPGSRTIMYPPGYPGARTETPAPLQLLPAASGTKAAKTPGAGSEPTKTEPKPSEKKNEPTKQ